MKKIIAMLLAASMTVALLVGCGSSTTEEPKAEETTDGGADSEGKIVVGVLMKVMSDTYSNKLGNAILSYAESTYPDVEVKLLDGKADTNTQINQCEDLIAEKVDVIILNAFDAEGSGRCVELANEAGIPIIEVNASTNNTDYLSYIGSNDVTAGEMLGQFIMDTVGEEGGQYAILEGDMGQSAQLDRYAGLENTILANDAFECVYTVSCKWQRDQAMNTTEDLLLKYPNLKAIACENDDMAMGALDACINNDRTDVVICGVDAIDDAKAAVKAGTLSGTILQDAQGQAETALDVAVKVAKGETVDELYYVPFVLITTDNVDDYL